jgi:purine-nucleoside phosphorylase
MSSDSFARFAESCRSAGVAVFVVLGSGTGPIIRRMDVKASLPFSAIPGLPPSSVLGHKGCLTLAQWCGRAVLVSEGRLHFYEGNSWEVVVGPIRLAAALGARLALLTNAAGGIRDDLGPGSLLPIQRHIEWNRPYPWREPEIPSPYSPGLLERIVSAGKSCGIEWTPGTYAAVTGPSYETPAEIRALRSVGADAVGMSTTREVLAGVAAGMECGAVSLITNRAAGLATKPIAHEEVLATAAALAERLADVLEAVIAS